MSQSELDNEDWFPNYIVVRRKANGSQESGQWQGFVKKIKTNFDKLPLLYRDLMMSESLPYTTDKIRG